MFHKLKIKLVLCQQISCGSKRGDFLNYRVERENKIGVTTSVERKKINCFFFPEEGLILSTCNFLDHEHQHQKMNSHLTDENIQ